MKLTDDELAVIKMMRAFREQHPEGKPMTIVGLVAVTKGGFCTEIATGNTLPSTLAAFADRLLCEAAVDLKASPIAEDVARPFLARIASAQQSLGFSDPMMTHERPRGRLHS